jgi:hypothetical protein
MSFVHSPVKRFVFLLLILALLSFSSVANAHNDSKQPVNIALGANPTESDPGWGGGTNAWDMVDGIKAYGNEWAHGLAFTGGSLPYIEACGVRQATLNFGRMKVFNRVLIWHHGIDHIPAIYNLQYWNGRAWITIHGARTVRYDLTTPDSQGAASTPTENIFHMVVGSKVRFQFDNCGYSVVVPQQRIVHGWIYEFEVFKDTPPQSPHRHDAHDDYHQHVLCAQPSQNAGNYHRGGH